MTKSYNILAKYHKDLLVEFGITGEDENGHMIFKSEKKQSERLLEPPQEAVGHKERRQFIKPRSWRFVL